MSGAGLAVRWLFHILNVYSLWMVCFAYFHSVLKYRIILGGNSACTVRYLCCKKRIVKIKTAIGCRSTCRRLFKKLDTLPIPCQYLFSLMMLVVNLEDLRTYFSVHGADTRNKAWLQRPVANLSCFQKGVFLCWYKDTYQYFKS